MLGQLKFYIKHLLALIISIAGVYGWGLIPKKYDLVSFALFLPAGALLLLAVYVGILLVVFFATVTLGLGEWRRHGRGF
jgi:hypothetical protein